MPVEFRTYTFEHHAEEVVVGLQQSLGDGIPLYMPDARLLAEHLHHAVAGTDGVGVDVVVFHQVLHLDVSAEACHLVADGVLESQHHADGDDHHHESDGDAHEGNTYSRATHLTLVALVAIDSFRYKKREIQRV